MKSKINLLFANGRIPAPFIIGGDGIGMDIFLSKIPKFGFKVFWYGSVDQHSSESIDKIKKYLKKRKIKYKYLKGVFSYRYHNYNVKIFNRSLMSKIIGEFLIKNVETVLITQLELSGLMLKIAYRSNIPILFFVHDVEKFNLRDIKYMVKNNKRGLIIFNSKFTANYYLKYVKNYNWKVIYPPILNHVKKHMRKNNKYITMINPVIKKGGRLLVNIARHMPDKDFLAVEGWYNPAIEGISFDKCPNIKYYPWQYNINNIFKRTKILIVPSLWKESFARVVPEAMSYGVPVLASYNSGLIESVGNAGMFVKKYNQASEWIDKINKIYNNNRLLQRMVSKGYRNISRFEANKMTGILSEMITFVRNNN